MGLLKNKDTKTKSAFVI